ncbi:hypothetical protein CYMTET_13335 [Cymbomonas tetramitiformis]|uniref:Uncharacterized protein n=1 Tax=Cymbomonas tetramitiformis TaxID=36881 RepID=A0AAE0GIB9_9CHLO|nr:hypothetical protein CYMTET_13335 [Cymbomonas tetramitiformis]
MGDTLTELCSLDGGLGKGGCWAYGILPNLDETDQQLLKQTCISMRLALAEINMPIPISKVMVSVPLAEWAFEAMSSSADLRAYRQYMWMACAQAASGGHLQVLQWAREQGCPWNAQTCCDAARGGHLEVLQWARAWRNPWNAKHVALRQSGGHLEVLRWAHENGCPWDAWTCSAAARKVDITVFGVERVNIKTPAERPDMFCCGEWWASGGAAVGAREWLPMGAREWLPMGRAWACSDAASGGHLEVLQWAREHGYPWDAWTCCNVARGGQPSAAAGVQEWLPMDTRTCSAAAGTRSSGVLQWARVNMAAHGAPKHVLLRREVGIWRCCSGCARMAAHGTTGHVAIPQRRIWRCPAVGVNMSAHGTPGHFASGGGGHLEVAAGGRASMAARGMSGRNEFC